MPTLVLEFEAAAANTSENFAASSACLLKAVKASVTISDTVPRSSSDAAARFIIPSIPSIICPAFQPAIAIYSIAFPDSVAENFVSLPIFLAVSFSFIISLLVALDIAPTALICFSKSLPTLVETPTTPTMAAPPILADFSTMLKAFDATFSILDTPLSKSLKALSQLLLFCNLLIALFASFNDLTALSPAAFNDLSTFPLIFIANSYSLPLANI